MNIIKKIPYYFKLWWLMSRNSFLMVLSQKPALLFFLTGKLLRFVFFFSFIFFLFKGTSSLLGYTQLQIIFFFLTFNIIDVLSQFLFREVYRFRPLIVSGDFDLIIVKPMNPLFRVLMGGVDLIDFLTIPPLIFAVLYFGQQLTPNFFQVLLYLVLLFNGLLISTAFHIAVLSLGIITLEIDHAIMIYRDIMNLGRFPVDIYRQPLQGVLTYLIPVGIIVSLPSKAFMGLSSSSGVIFSLILGVLSIFISLKFWKYALTKYTSASS